MRLAFNDYLYRLRVEKGFSSPKKFAKELGISAFKYGCYERGYLQPKGKEKDIIEKYTGESLDPYLVGRSSYPAPMKPKKNQVFRGLSKLFKNRIARIITYVIAGLGILCIPAAAIIDYRNDSKRYNFYDANYAEIYNKVREEGTFTIDLAGYFDKREISIVESGVYYVTVKAPVSQYGMTEIYYEAVLRNDLERYDIKYKNADNISFTLSDNGTGEYWSYHTERTGQSTFKSGTISNSHYLNKWNGTTAKAFINDSFSKLISDCDALFEKLFTEKFDKPNINFYNDVLTVKKHGDTIQNNLTTAYNITAFIGLPLGVIALAMILLWWLYMYPEKMLTMEVHELSKEQEEQSEHQKHAPLPNNKIRLSFFVGENAIRVIGVILLFLGSVRTIFAILAKMGVLTLLDRTFNTGAMLNVFVNVFFLGVFMNYITEMDSLNDEHRLFRNLVVYGLLFITIGIIQTCAVIQLDYMGNGIIYSLEAQLPNNIFGLVFLFFLTAVFLYYLPKKFEGKRKLTLMWRWFSLLPVIAVFSLYFLIQFVPTLFGYSTPKYVAYFFGAERLPFAVLTFIYLFGTYFLRRYYYRKYGVKNARVFFNGDRYIYIKNFILVAGAIGLGISELVFFIMLPNNAFGFGQSIYIAIIAPLFALFKPRNGNRNIGTSIVSSGLYITAIIVYYSITIALVVFYGFTV